MDLLDHFYSPDGFTLYGFILWGDVKYLTIKLSKKTALAANSIFDSNDITISPNPINNYFTIESKNRTIQRIEVYNSFGKNVLSQSGTSINSTKWSSGVYYIKTYFEHGNEVNKIVK